MPCSNVATRSSRPSSKPCSAGGKVVGHFQVSFPEEIVHAAGMLPFKARSRVELDMFVSHPICDAARDLAATWGRNFEYPCQPVYLPQNRSSAGHSLQPSSEAYSARSTPAPWPTARPWNTVR